MRFMISVWIVLLLLLGNGLALAQQLREDSTHVRVWNRFADQTLDLHRELIERLPVERETEIDGYAQLPEFYRQESYYHDDKLVSRVQWEKESGELHVIEVFIRNDQGRVVRDYTAAYLPHYRNAPTQTLVSFHAYNDDLHAFRSFDASGDLVVERCTGKLDGEEVHLLVDLGAVFQSAQLDDDIRQSREYQVCFEGLPQEPGKYLSPQ